MLYSSIFHNEYKTHSPIPYMDGFFPYRDNWWETLTYNVYSFLPNLRWGITNISKLSMGPAVVQQIMWRIDRILVGEYRLVAEVKAKPICRMNDVGKLLNSIFSDLILRSFGTGRAVLYFVLFINLAINSCRRIGEIICSSKAPIIHILCIYWSDVEIWVKRAEMILRTTFRILLLLSISVP